MGNKIKNFYLKKIEKKNNINRIKNKMSEEKLLSLFNVVYEKSGYEIMLNYGDIILHAERFKKRIMQENKIKTSERLKEIAKYIRTLMDILSSKKKKEEYLMLRTKIVNVDNLIKLSVMLIVNYSNMCVKKNIILNEHIIDLITKNVNNFFQIGNVENIKSTLNKILEIDVEDKLYDNVLHEITRLIMLILIIKKQKILEIGYKLILCLAREMQTAIDGQLSIEFISDEKIYFEPLTFSSDYYLKLPLSLVIVTDDTIFNPFDLFT
jgi:hypothetical protein